MNIIIGKDKNEKIKDSVELVKDEKHFKMTLSNYNELEVSYFTDNKDEYWFQESFEINKNDGEIYDAVDGIFLSYGGDVYFDTHGANLILLNNEDSYSFLFVKEFTEYSNEIKCKFFNDSIENDSMLYMFNRLNKLDEKTKEQTSKPKTLSKTLNKIVEK